MARIHYEFGLIGYDELHERIQVALWIEDETCADPRIEPEDEKSLSKENESNYSDLNETMNCRLEGLKPTNGPNWIEFLCLGIWVFTKADADSYPSVPHGHFKNQNAKWPKLNPYTGRIFKSKHQEDKSNRLNRKQMQIIWSDEKFKSFCREMIIWYQEQFPHHNFPVRNALRFPVW